MSAIPLIDGLSAWMLAAVGAGTWAVLQMIGNMIFRYRTLRVLREIRDELKASRAAPTPTPEKKSPEDQAP